MMGFCNGLALVIGLAQFSNFKVPPHATDSVESHLNTTGGIDSRRLGAFDAFTDDVPWISGLPAVMAIAIVAISFFTCLFLPKLTTRVPSALMAIIAGTAFEWLIVRLACHSATTIVGNIAPLKVGGDFPIPMWFDSRYAPPPLNMDTLQKCLPLAVTMSAVGLLESLMTLNLIDEITRTGHSSTRRECFGQGIANIVCGACAGMGGCAMIGQSMINVGSGARHRVSSICAGVTLMLIVLVAGPVVNRIPVSALVGVMFNVVYHTFEWHSLKLILLAAMPEKTRLKLFSKKTGHQKMRRFDAVIIVAVTLVTLFTNLATAVGVGMLLALFAFALESADLISVVTRASGGVEAKTKIYEVHGILFFGSTSKFLELFDEDGDPEDVRLVFPSGYIADYSAVEALNKLGERYGAKGKRLTLQQLEPRSTRIVSSAAGLLVEEITLEVKEEEVIPAEREHFNVEHFPGIDPTLVVSEAEAKEIFSGDRGESNVDDQSDLEDTEDRD
uniref:SLC26A/SulP transporter domain-containing protein n=1 Tax=Alexandrium catenella TaxID=2925 RepID=A0A7S1RMC9_ALECA